MDERQKKLYIFIQPVGEGSFTDLRIHDNQMEVVFSGKTEAKTFDLYEGLEITIRTEDYDYGYDSYHDYEDEDDFE